MAEASARALKYPWAKLGDRFVHISMVDDADIQAETREGVPFRCPSSYCGAALTPRALHSTEIRPHFAHPPGSECGFNPETVVHMAAKAHLMKRPELLLPLLRFDPLDPESTIAEAARVAKWDSVEPEETVLGRWRADIVLWNEISEREEAPDDPFLIIEEEGRPPLVVEVVVTSRVDPRKTKAVQDAGWRMLEIRLGADSAASRDIGALVAERAPRHWLAHPTWRDALERRRIAAEHRAKERAARADVNIRRIQERVLAGKDLIHWDPEIREALTVCARDNQLAPHVLVQTPFQHWMAAAREWWRIDLLRQAVFDEIAGGDEEPILPEPEQALACVKDYVIKLPATKPTHAVLDGLDLPHDGWGTPIDAVRSFLASLLETGFAERDGGYDRVTPYIVSLAQRHHAIDRLLLPIFHMTATRSIAYGNLLRWKDSSPVQGGPSRREIIIRGGDGYEGMLDAVRELHRKRLPYADHEEHERTDTIRRPPRSKIPDPEIEEAPRHLSAVYEVERETRIEPEDADEGVQTTKSSVDESLVEELRREAQKAFRDADTERQRQKVDLFLFSRHPRIDGRSPRDACTDRAGLERCIALLKVRKYKMAADQIPTLF